MSDNIFISYARADSHAAERLAAGLRAEGFSVFLDRDRLRGGGFAAQLEQAIKRCDVFVLLISRASVASAYVNRELHVAADDFARPVLPVVLEDADLSPFRLAIAGLQRVEYRGSDAELADVVDGVYRVRAESRRHRPHAGARLAGGIGAGLAAVGVLVCLAGMGYFFMLFAQAWNAPLGTGPPDDIPLAFGIFFVGMVIGIVGEGLRRAGRRIR
jgi:hypothetical protein